MVTKCVYLVARNAYIVDLCTHAGAGRLFLVANRLARDWLGTAAAAPEWNLPMWDGKSNLCTFVWTSKWIIFIRFGNEI